MGGGGGGVEVLAPSEVDLLVVVLQGCGPRRGLVAIPCVPLPVLVLILVLVFGTGRLGAPRQLLEDLLGFGAAGGTFGQDLLQTHAARRGHRRGRRHAPESAA